jgi:hypothetical protein
MTKVGWVIFDIALQVPVQIATAFNCCRIISEDTDSLGIGT